MPPVLIKKYGNRRLYDTDASSYITLEELADKIRSGVDVRVLDAKSSEDLTQSTLTQIIIESRRAAQLLPVPLLMQLIRMGDDALAEFLGRYMSWALELYLQAKQGAQALTPINPLATLPFSATNALARLLLGATSFVEGRRDVGAPAAGAAEAAASSEDVASLRRELEALKRAVKRRRR